MTDHQTAGLEINWAELRSALRKLMPDHVGGQPDWVEYIRDLAAATDFYDSDELYQAAEGHSGQEGAETAALLIACHWLRNVKSDFLSNSAFKVTSRQVAQLHLVHIDELVPQLVTALQMPILPLAID